MFQKLLQYGLGNSSKYVYPAPSGNFTKGTTCNLMQMAHSEQFWQRVANTAEKYVIGLLTVTDIKSREQPACQEEQKTCKEESMNVMHECGNSIQFRQFKKLSEVFLYPTLPLVAYLSLAGQSL